MWSGRNHQRLVLDISSNFEMLIFDVELTLWVSKAPFSSTGAQ